MKHFKSYFEEAKAFLDSLLYFFRCRYSSFHSRPLQFHFSKSSNVNRIVSPSPPPLKNAPIAFHYDSSEQSSLPPVENKPPFILLTLFFYSEHLSHFVSVAICLVSVSPLEWKFRGSSGFCSSLLFPVPK